jgi:hypothetical protein
MTGFIAYVFPYPNRVSFKEAFEELEPDDGKLSRPVLRGPGLRDGVRLLDPGQIPKSRVEHRFQDHSGLCRDSTPFALVHLLPHLLATRRLQVGRGFSTE